MSSFPCDILDNIFSRLPAVSLFQLRVVCKLWKHVIDDPLFVKSHTRDYQLRSSGNILIRNGYNGKLFSISLDQLSRGFQHDTLIAANTIPVKQLCHRGLPLLLQVPAPSCNGLILISHKYIDKSWAIWNPLVQDFHEIPPQPSVTGTGSLISIGFGYDESSDDYKIVRINRNMMDCGSFRKYECISLIYSTRSRRWRKLEGFPGSACRGDDQGVFLNGVLHWRSRQGIIALHLGREDHELVALPPLPPNTLMLPWESLDALDGCLLFSRGYGCMNVWVMKDYESKVWKKLFTVFDRRRLRVVGYMKSKGQVFLKHEDIELILIDLQNKCSRKITIFGFWGTCWLSLGQFSPESLVRVDSTKRRSQGVKREKDMDDVYAMFGERMCLYNVRVYHA